VRGRPVQQQYGIRAYCDVTVVGLEPLQPGEPEAPAAPVEPATQVEVVRVVGEGQVAGVEAARAARTELAAREAAVPPAAATGAEVEAAVETAAAPRVAPERSQMAERAAITPQVRGAAALTPALDRARRLQAVGVVAAMEPMEPMGRRVKMLEVPALPAPNGAPHSAQVVAEEAAGATGPAPEEQAAREVYTVAGAEAAASRLAEGEPAALAQTGLSLSHTLRLQLSARARPLLANCGQPLERVSRVDDCRHGRIPPPGDTRQGDIHRLAASFGKRNRPDAPSHAQIWLSAQESNDAPRQDSARLDKRSVILGWTEAIR
jgi:hypothetical protein